VLGARLPQHRDALARHQVDAAQVHVELEVELLGGGVGHRAADPDAGVVDEDVEAAEALPVRLGQLLDLLLVGHVGGHGVHVEPHVAQALRGGLELVGPAGRDRDAVAVLAEGAGDGQPDSARASGDECGAPVHWPRKPI
jgi:hypothetical protein